MKCAILGASGLVGRTMLVLLQERDWVDDDPLLLTSTRSAGRSLDFRGRELVCRDAAAADLAGIEVALLSAGTAASRTYAPQLVKVGAWIVDNSSAWRADPDVPLLVPEVNLAQLPDRRRLVAGGGIVANPNCSTIEIAVAVAPLQQAFGLREVHVTTLQAVSGAGQSGLDELRAQMIAGGDDDPTVGGATFPRRIAFNAVPEIGTLGDDGFFTEESKVGSELRKILADDRLQVSCTATRVPVWNGHAAAVRVVLASPATPAQAREVMARWPGLRVADGPGQYVTPAEISGDFAVHVGRLRQDPDRGDALLLWVVADNLLKGAAWNAVQIADLLVAEMTDQGVGNPESETAAKGEADAAADSDVDVDEATSPGDAG